MSQEAGDGSGNSQSEGIRIPESADSGVSTTPTSNETAAAVAAPVASAPPSVGEFLRSAREAQSLSVGDIASRLRMSVKQVAALEAGEFSKVPTGTFLRGFVRSYAKQVSIDPAEAIRILESTQRDSAALEASPIVAPTQNIQLTKGEREIAQLRTRILVFAIAFLVASLIVFYWWSFVRPYRAEGGRPAESQQVTSLPLVNAAPQTTAAAPTSGSSGDQVGAVGAPAGESANRGTDPATEANQAQKSTDQSMEAKPSARPDSPAAKASEAPTKRTVSASAVGEGVLGFTFKGESWVEVVDGAGKTVMSRRFGNGEAGEVTGRLPLSIVIGNAPATRMAFNGQEFDLAPHTKVAVARVTLK